MIRECKTCGALLLLANAEELCTECKNNIKGYTKFHLHGKESLILMTDDIINGDAKAAVEAIEAVGFIHNLYEMGPDYIPSNGFNLADTEAWQTIKKFILEKKN